MNWLERRVPAIGWLPAYPRTNLRGDVSAGLTVAVMLIPQAMAYALLAGLPPIVGLYASVVPLAVYALLGTSRQLAVGPVAMVSLLVVAAVSRLAQPGTERYIAYAVSLALIVGVLQLAMGVARLGFLVRFLSHPVVTGFTWAAALIIGASQLGGVLGVNLERSHQVHDIVLDAVRRSDDINGPTLVLALGAIALLVVGKRYAPRFPSPLAVVAVSTLLVGWFELAPRGVRIVGEVPAGFPLPQGVRIDVASLLALLPTGMVIAFVGFMESIAVAKALAARHRYEVDPNQELVALGAANVAGAFFGGYPVTGGFSRTAVNDQAGARTGLASLITALVVALTLVLLTPLFHFLPVAVLAAIILVAVASLIDVRELVHLFEVKHTDAGLLLVTFLATLGLGLEQGIAVGVGASLLMFIVRTTRPHTAQLGRLPGSEGVYRNVRRFPEAKTFPGLIVLRVDATFYFANMDFLREHLRRIEAELEEPLRALIIDASSINDLDSSAVEALSELARVYRERNVALYFAQVKGPVRDIMQRSGFSDELGPSAFTFTIQQAVDAYLQTEAARTAANSGAI